MNAGTNRTRDGMVVEGHAMDQPSKSKMEWNVSIRLKTYLKGMD